MYATCLLCAGPLGRNDLLEAFPVGRRLAWDLAGGRLWVVCARCGSWNLAPFEERWDAMEDAERRYRATRTRVTTGELGLARLRDGRGAVDLVRIGRPLRPEFSAWRYGERFVTRYRRARVALGAGIVGGFANLALTPVAGTAIATGVMAAAYATQWYLDRQKRDVRLLLPGGERPVVLKSDDLQRTRLVARGEHFALRLVHASPRRSAIREHVTTLEGDDALRAARVVLPALNASGGDRKTVDTAVGLLEASLGGSHVATIDRLATHGPLRLSQHDRVVTGREDERWLTYVPLERRLALEMALNEDVERRAMEGELALLEVAWREAETIARIADSLAVPAAVESTVARMREAPPGR